MASKALIWNSIFSTLGSIRTIPREATLASAQAFVVHLDTQDKNSKKKSCSTIYIMFRNLGGPFPEVSEVHKTTVQTGGDILYTIEH